LLIGNYLWRNRKWQNILLFGGSLYFYAWGEKEKVFVMLATIVVNYFIGILIEKNDKERKRKLFLTIGIVVNLGVLVYFKYSKFLVENLNGLLMMLGFSEIKDLKYEKLPLGISFYVFQSLSYLIDVYRKQVKVQRNFLNLGLYVTLFPQLVAGPIVRYNDIEEQLEKRVHSLSDFVEGIRRFVIGLAKKMLLANPIAFAVDGIYALPPDEISIPLVWLAAIGYTLQIYFDFSGYSDMAIGLGRMFGFRILENFNYPYISKSIREFWNRWHISLSIWFRDYLYIPLGGSRNGNFATYRNLLIVFLTTGLWHGASWSFIVWGLFHGFFMVIERLGFDKILQKLPRLIQVLYTLVVVSIGFILFRVEEWESALFIVKTSIGLNIIESSYTINMFMNNYLWLVFVVAILASFPVWQWLKVDYKSNKIFQFLSYSFYLIIFIYSVMAMTSNTYNPFIYFRF
jgi:alginate O-acetyltransferase complex protein AlgI